MTMLGPERQDFDQIGMEQDTISSVDNELIFKTLLQGRLNALGRQCKQWRILNYDQLIDSLQQALNDNEPGYLLYNKFQSLLALLKNSFRGSKSLQETGLQIDIKSEIEKMSSHLTELKRTFLEVDITPQRRNTIVGFPAAKHQGDGTQNGGLQQYAATCGIDIDTFRGALQNPRLPEIQNASVNDSGTNISATEMPAGTQNVPEGLLDSVLAQIFDKFCYVLRAIAIQANQKKITKQNIIRWFIKVLYEKMDLFSGITGQEVFLDWFRNEASERDYGDLRFALAFLLDQKITNGFFEGYLLIQARNSSVPSRASISGTPVSSEIQVSDQSTKPIIAVNAQPIVSEHAKSIDATNNLFDQYLKTLENLPRNPVKVIAGFQEFINKQVDELSEDAIRVFEWVNEEGGSQDFKSLVESLWKSKIKGLTKQPTESKVAEYVPDIDLAAMFDEYYGKAGQHTSLAALKQNFWGYCRHQAADDSPFLSWLKSKAALEDFDWKVDALIEKKRSAIESLGDVDLIISKLFYNFCTHASYGFIVEELIDNFKLYLHNEHYLMAISPEDEHLLSSFLENGENQRVLDELMQNLAELKLRILYPGDALVENPIQLVQNPQDPPIQLANHAMEYIRSTARHQKLLQQEALAMANKIRPQHEVRREQGISFMQRAVGALALAAAALTLAPTKPQPQISQAQKTVATDLMSSTVKASAHFGKTYKRPETKTHVEEVAFVFSAEGSLIKQLCQAASQKISYQKLQEIQGIAHGLERDLELSGLMTRQEVHSALTEAAQASYSAERTKQIEALKKDFFIGEYASDMAPFADFSHEDLQKILFNSKHPLHQKMKDNIKKHGPIGQWSRHINDVPYHSLHAEERAMFEEVVDHLHGKNGEPVDYNRIAPGQKLITVTSEGKVLKFMQRLQDINTNGSVQAQTAVENSEIAARKAQLEKDLADLADGWE